jgi:hypothetical protein
MANAGRMNSQGISMFYGATDIATCISEVRPPVGSHTVVGTFNSVKKLKILNFDLLTNVVKDFSYFEPGSSEKIGRVAFLRNIVKQLEKPIMPNDSYYDYLPTQIISEYLCNKVEPRVDGIIFSSSQVSTDGKNIVLFNHSSITKPYKLNSNVDFSVNFGWHSNDDYDDSISIHEETDVKSKEPTNDLNLGNINDDLFHTIETTINNKEISLELDVDKIMVFEINAANFETNKRITTRYRTNKQDDDF